MIGVLTLAHPNIFLNPCTGTKEKQILEGSDGEINLTMENEVIVSTYSYKLFLHLNKGM